MTNFNSIVNQNITINKLFFEVCIPKIFSNTNKLSLNASKVKEYVKHKDLYNQISNIKMDKFTSSLHSNNKPQNTQSTSASSATKPNLASVSQKKDAPIKIPQLFRSDFNTVRKAVFNTPLHNQMDNNLLLENHSYLSQPTYFSPNSFHTQSLKKMNNSISGIYSSNSFSVYVSPNFSQHIPSSPNLSYINNRNLFMPPPLYSFNQNSDYDLFSKGGGLHRRMSENNINNNKDNSIISSYSSRSNYMGYSNLNNSFIQNNNLSLLSLSKPSIFGDEYSRYSGLVNNGYVSPRSVRNFQLINEIGLRKFGFESANKSVHNFSNSTLGIGPQISTIYQKISNYNTDDEQDLNDDIIPIEHNLNIKIDPNLSAFIKQNDGSCNLLIFIKNVTPYIHKYDADNYVYIYIIFRCLLVLIGFLSPLKKFLYLE